jgi:hypothetical protein
LPLTAKPDVFLQFFGGRILAAELHTKSFVRCSFAGGVVPQACKHLENSPVSFTEGRQEKARQHFPSLSSNQ